MVENDARIAPNGSKGGAWGVGIAIVVIIAMVKSCTGGPNPMNVPPRRVEDIIASEIHTIANQQKQQIFERIHPVGTARGVIIHDVTVTAWKRGQESNRIEDVLQFTVRYTLYWQGPITRDGYTKVSETFDTESQRYVAGQILATNGVTREDVGYAIGFIGGALLREAVDPGQQ